MSDLPRGGELWDLIDSRGEARVLRSKIQGKSLQREEICGRAES